MNKKKKVKGLALQTDEDYIFRVETYGDGGEWLNVAMAMKAARKTQREYKEIHPKIIPVEINFPAPKKNLEKRNKK